MDLKHELIALLTKWQTYIFYVLISIMAKLSYDISRNKKMTFWQTMGTIGIAFFIGAITSIVCSMNHFKYEAIIVPGCTLISDKIVTYFMLLDWNKIIDFVTTFLKPKQ